MSCLGFSLGQYGNDAAVSFTALEVNYAVNEGIKRMVAAHAYVLAGMMYSTALTHDDVTSDAGLATPNLNA